MNPSTALGGILVSGGPYDTVTGLPVHSLIVHVAVVLLPLSALALIALVLVPKWRRSFIWVTLAGLLIGSGAAFVSKESGQALAARVGNPVEHAKWGDLLPFIAVGLIVVAALWFWLERRAAKSGEGPALTRGSGLVALTGMASVVLALVSIGMTVVVGHTGAEAVWADQIVASDAVASGSQVAAAASTLAVAGSPPAVGATGTAPTSGATGTAPTSGATGTAPTSGATVYTLADVAAHNQVADCWSVVNGKVYDLTSWISQHPGGPEVITQMCGVDASQGFNGQHSGQGKPNKELATFEIGTLGSATAANAGVTGTTANPASFTTPSTRARARAKSYTAAQVKAHATASNCWTIVNGSVYNVTSWIKGHPGGPSRILSMCGVDASAAFNGQHGGAADVAKILKSFKVGKLV